MALVVTTGFGHGSTAGWTTGNASSMFASVATGAIVTTSPHGGTYCYERNTAGQFLSWNTTLIGSSNKVGVLNFWVYFPSSLPSAEVAIAQFSMSSIPDYFLTYNNSTGKFKVHNDTGTVNTDLSTGPTANTWHHIEFKMDASTSTAKIDTWLDGAAQTQMTNVNAISNIASVGFPFSTVIGNGAGTFRIDDVAIYTDAAAITTPIGPHSVKFLSVDPAGTVTVTSSGTPFSLFTANGTIDSTFVAASARDNIKEIPPLIGATATGFVQDATGTTDYVQIPMTSYTLASGETIAGVRMEAVGWAVSNATATLGFRSWNGTTETILQAGTVNPLFDNSTTTPGWVCKMLTLADIDTQTELDALEFRVGFSSDANPDIGIHAIYAEVAVLVPSGINVAAEAVAVTGVANAATTGIAPHAEAVAATAIANQATITTNNVANAGAVAVTATANAATPSVAAHAEAVAVTAVANVATAGSIKAEVVLVTAVADNSAVTVSNGLVAEAVAVVVVANDAAIIAGNVEAVAVIALANSATVHTSSNTGWLFTSDSPLKITANVIAWDAFVFRGGNPSAQCATATVTANNVSVPSLSSNTGWLFGVNTPALADHTFGGIAQAFNPSVAIVGAIIAGVATASAVAKDTSVGKGVEAVSVTAVAQDASVSHTGSTTVTGVQVAQVSAIAGQGVVGMHINSASATALGKPATVSTASGPGVKNVFPTTSAVSALANSPTVTTPSVKNVFPTLVAVSVSANNATVTTSVAKTVFPPAVVITVSANNAAGSGASAKNVFPTLVTVSVTANNAAVTVPTVKNVFPELAMVSVSANNATVTVPVPKNVFPTTATVNVIAYNGIGVHPVTNALPTTAMVSAVAQRTKAGQACEDATVRKSLNFIRSQLAPLMQATSPSTITLDDTYQPAQASTKSNSGWLFGGIGQVSGKFTLSGVVKSGTTNTGWVFPPYHSAEHEQLCPITITTPVASIPDTYRGTIAGTVSGLGGSTLYKVQAYKRTDIDYSTGVFGDISATGTFSFSLAAVPPMSGEWRFAVVLRTTSAGQVGAKWPQDITHKNYILEHREIREANYLIESQPAQVNGLFRFTYPILGRQQIRLIDTLTGRVIAQYTDLTGCIRSFVVNPGQPGYGTAFAEQCYVYDQGVALSTTIAINDATTGRELLKGLLLLQTEGGVDDGGFIYSAQQLSPTYGAPVYRTGSHAVALYSLLHFMDVAREGHKAVYRNAAIRALNWLETQLTLLEAPFGAYAGLYRGGSGAYSSEISVFRRADQDLHIDWAVAEVNFAVWHALNLASRVISQEPYATRASLLKNKILELLWNSDLGRFNRSYQSDGPDESESLALHGAGALWLHAVGLDEQARLTLSDEQLAPFNTGY